MAHRPNSQTQHETDYESVPVAASNQLCGYGRHYDEDSIRPVIWTDATIETLPRTVFTDESPSTLEATIRRLDWVLLRRHYQG